MKVDQLAEVERGQHVAVHDEERVVEALDQPERRRGAERAGLVDVLDGDAVRPGVIHHRPDEVGEVPDAQRDVSKTRLAQALDDDLEDRLLADRQERLGQDGGVRCHPRPAPAAQDHGLHATASRSSATTRSTSSAVMWG